MSARPSPIGFSAHWAPVTINPEDPENSRREEFITHGRESVSPSDFGGAGYQFLRARPRLNFSPPRAVR
jgi:hypothetical protein